MNLKQAKSLKTGDILHYTGHGLCEKKTKSGHTGVIRWKVNGEPKTWKTRPDMVVVPIKFGLYKFGQIHENEVESWHLESECPLLADPVETDSQEDPVEYDTNSSGQRLERTDEWPYVKVASDV